MDRQGLDRLRLGIVLSCIEDYYNALDGKISGKYNGMYRHTISADEMRRECEGFFRSQWFRELFDIDTSADRILKALQTGDRKYAKGMKWNLL